MFSGIASLALAYVFFFEYLRHTHRVGILWRVIGYIVISASFLIYEFARRYTNVYDIGLILEVLGFFFIFIGIYNNPQLIVVDSDKNNTTITLDNKLSKNVQQLSIFLGVLLIILFGLLYTLPDGKILINFLGVFIILLTLFLQIKRYYLERTKERSNLLNLLPIFAFIALFIREILLIIINLPQDIKIAFLREQMVDFSPVFIIILIGTFIGFFLLLVLNWKFLVSNFTERLFIILVVLSIGVASTGSLSLNFLVFDQMRANNIDLVNKGAKVQSLVLNERGKKAQYLASTLAKDTRIVSMVKDRNINSLTATLKEEITDSGLDILKIYTPYNEVLLNTIDPRENGTLYQDDQFITFVISGKRGLMTFDTTKGVMAPEINIRSIYPILINSEVIGAIEAGYKFDNAFADFIKKQTDFDFTIYSDTLRSASTIKTNDGVSRWIGTMEENPEVLNSVIKKGEVYNSESLIFGGYYFTSYLPLKDINGVVIGMLSAQSSVDVVIENTRQQFVTTFITITNLALIGSLVAYLLIRTTISKDKKRSPKLSLVNNKNEKE
jgi:hypothetical protein